MTMHPLIIQHVSHALRVRVLQELQILARQLRRAQTKSPPLVRRLTREELDDIRSSGVVRLKDAVAIVVVPPVNRDPETGERPQPNWTSSPTKEDLEPPRRTSQSFPLSVLYPTSQGETFSDPLQLLPSSCVPLYNGVPLFPSRTQRAALYAALNRVLRAEHTAGLTDGEILASQDVVGSKKTSHAFLISSSEQTLFRGDTVPLAIALWRLRMWEANHEEAPVVNWILKPSSASL